MIRFKLIREAFIPELDTHAKIYEHTPTGAEILSMPNGDENKCFGIAFRTPPSDSTGVAHILEHAVLCGSEKYPVKDPFVQLLKGSLQTFLNAFTYPDKTCYLVASQNIQDFHNLVGVYLDAVFRPRITRDCFMQEGWHYHLEHIDDLLEFKGVVYNEMKGVYSSPDSILMEASQQSLYPDTTYGLDSGGNPKFIPDLEYDQFKAFHAAFYHPSNARIFFYGNDPEEVRFELLEEYLNTYTKVVPPSDIDRQQRFVRPVRIEKKYAVSAEDDDPKPMFTVNWMLSSPTNSATVFAFILLDHILLGTPASPLRKALIESGLGEDIAGGGTDTHILQMMFSIGMKGVAAGKLEEAEQLILDTLNGLVEQGLDQDDLSAALNTFEFDLRENNSGGFPRGLALWLKSLNGWIYGADPLEIIAFEQPLKKIKEQCRSKGFFEEVIKKHFIENPHRSTVILRPDPQLAAQTETEERARLETIKAAMTTAELKQIVAHTKRLLKLQAQPDSAAAVAALPLLKRKDLDKNSILVEQNVREYASVQILEHPLFSNGIVYLDLGLNLDHLGAAEMPYASLLGNMLIEMGTRRENYISLSQRIAKTTGGIYGIPFIAPHEEEQRSVLRFFLRGKCMRNQTRELLDIFADILCQPMFDDHKRFRQIALEQKADLESSLIPRGHSAVMTRLKARDHEASWANEKVSGIEALFFIRELVEKIDTAWPDVLASLNNIHRKLVNRNTLILNITADAGNMPTLRDEVMQFIEKLPAESNIKPERRNRMLFPPSEALTAPTQVNYVGASANLFNHGYQLHGSALVITRYLQTAWLWEKIRVQGGAYGSVCSFDQRAGTFVFASYRDPNVEESLAIYQQTGNFLKTLKLDQAELTRALIGAIGQLDSYQLPDAKSYSSCQRTLLGYSDQARQKLRDEVLATTQKNFNIFGEILDEALRTPQVVVLCDQDAAQAAGLKSLTRVL